MAIEMKTRMKIELKLEIEMETCGKHRKQLSTFVSNLSHPIYVPNAILSCDASQRQLYVAILPKLRVSAELELGEISNMLQKMLGGLFQTPV